MKALRRNANAPQVVDAAATLPCLGYFALRGDCENIALATLLVRGRAQTATSWSFGG